MFDRVLNTSITWIKNNAFAQFYSIYLLYIIKMAFDVLAFNNNFISFFSTLFFILFLKFQNNFSKVLSNSFET